MSNTDQIQNTKRQRLVVVLFSLLIVVIFIVTWARVYVRGDYMLSSEVECDPAEESCFVRLCEEDCDPEAMQEFYKIRTLAANYASTCNPTVETCPDLLCSDIPTCVEELCTEENVHEGEWCNDPESYRASLSNSNESETIEEVIEEPEEASSLDD